ncbi:MAG: BON domain-containing protein, partial [Deltaproteobacteria bacterium]
MKSMATAHKATALRLLVGGMLILGSAVAQARADAKPQDRSIEIPLGSAQTVRVASIPERVVVGDPVICDVTPMGPGQLLLVAKSPGETQITVWTRDGSIVSYRVVASLPTMALHAALREAFPEEDITVRASAGAVYLTGKVTDAMTAEAASRIAQNLYASSGRKVAEVVNLLQVQAPQQVQVHMRFVEITRSNLRQIGFNHFMNNANMASGMFGPNDEFHYCLTCDTQRFIGPNNYPAPKGGQAPAMGSLPILTSPISGSFALSFASSSLLPITATLALLEQNGVAKTLSEPTLVAMSGREAKFLVGGEVPIPMPDALGHILVQFKQYGAKISFTPTVLNQD